MAITRKMYKRIDNIFQDGLSRNLTIRMFIELTDNSADASDAIEEFFVKNYRLVSRIKKEDFNDVKISPE